MKKVAFKGEVSELTEECEEIENLDDLEDGVQEAVVKEEEELGEQAVLDVKDLGHKNEDQEDSKVEENAIVDSSDEAPEEIKTVKSLENEEEVKEAAPEDANVKAVDVKSKKPRKRKQRPSKGGTNKAEGEKDEDEEEEGGWKPRAKASRLGVLEQRIRPPSLLERLLLQEIRRERNTVLQCVRHVVRSNFFQGQPRPQEQPRPSPAESS